MAKLLRFAIFLGCFFSAGSAFAAGGTCPTGAVYGANSNATLSSLGITSCYYIAANGSDSNDGLSEASGHPWAHAPGMPNCSSSCAIAASACASNQCAGYGFVFRGGDTWHFGASTTPATGGMWNVPNGGTGGTLSNPIYLGVDQAWYTGSAWARPMMTGDNPVCGPSTVGSGCTKGSLSTYKLSQYYVSSCAYQVGSSNHLFTFSGSSHFILDNFEITGLCQSAPGQPGNHDEYISYGSSGDMKFLNLYLHGWTHVQYADVNGGGGCNSGNVCFGISIFAGGNSSTPDDLHTYEVIDGSDSDPVAAQACYCDFWEVSYSYIGNQSNIITRYPHLFHDNLFEYWYENGHGNVLESVGDASGTNAVYNNVFRHVNTTADPGDPMFWPYPPPGTTDYFFNNVSYDVTNMEYFNVGQNAPETSGQGPLVVFNNTFQNNAVSGGGIFGCTSSYPLTWTAANNHYITEGSSAYNSTKCTTGGNTDMTSLLMNNATATTAGYTASQAYAYAPTLYGSPTASANSPTVRVGTNESTQFCGALSSSSDPMIQAAGTACNAGTTYACSYNSSNHTVSCPALIPTPIKNPRPASVAWDQGAYQTNSSAPNPAKNPTVTVP